MKSKRLLWCAALAILATTGVICIVWFWGNKPFNTLKSEEIVSAQVQVLPPDTKMQINDRDTIEELTDILRKAVIYRQDDSYKEYVGQAVRFTVEMRDGRKLEVVAYNPFLIINGIGYRTKYEPCEALNMLGNRLIGK